MYAQRKLKLMRMYTVIIRHRTLVPGILLTVDAEFATVVLAEPRQRISMLKGLL